MAMIETWVNQDLTAPVQVVYLPGNVFSQDNNGNLIGVNVFQGGEPATLSGSVSASVIRADGATVAVTGSLSGNQCSVVLPQACYAVPGVLSIVIKLTSGETVTTVGAVVGNVYRSSTDAVVDPGTIIPDISTLVQEIEDAIASVPADYSALLGFIAGEYSSSSTYLMGQYAWYNGALKKCTVAITTPESYNSAHWTDVVIGNDIANYLGFRRYLTSGDDVFLLSMGTYGISPSAQFKPQNLPEDYPESASGFVTVLEYENGNATFEFLTHNYAGRLWVRMGYGWYEVSKYADVQNQIGAVYAYLYEKLIPSYLNVASGYFVAGTEITSTKTQYRFLDDTGVQEIGQSYPDWYVTNEITVEPFTFYLITASAQYNSHCIYNILDGNGNIIASEAATSSTVLSVTEKLIFTPYNAAKIQLASITGASGAAIYESVEKDEAQVWAGKKWVCIGDSLTDTNIRTTKHYFDYVAEKTGITVVNLGKGGTGYKREYAGEGPFIDRVDQIPLDADVVTIFGSGNDAIYTIGDPSDTGTDTLCGAINTTIAAIFARKVTCQLGIVTPCPWESYNPADDTNWMARYSAAIVEICRRWGIPCLDLYHCSNLRPWEAAFRAAAYSKDDGNGVHPDETGHAIIAPRFQSFVESLLLH